MDEIRLSLLLLLRRPRLDRSPNRILSTSRSTQVTRCEVPLLSVHGFNELSPANGTSFDTHVCGSIIAAEQAQTIWQEVCTLGPKTNQEPSIQSTGLQQFTAAAPPHVSSPPGRGAVGLVLFFPSFVFSPSQRAAVNWQLHAPHHHYCCASNKSQVKEPVERLLQQQRQIHTTHLPSIGRRANPPGSCGRTLLPPSAPYTSLQRQLTTVHDTPHTKRIIRTQSPGRSSFGMTAAWYGSCTYFRFQCGI